MKKLINLLIMCLMLSKGFAQKTQVFALSPMPKNLEKVNGMVVGFGFFENKGLTQTINGVNVDLMIFSPMIVMLGVMHGSTFKQVHTDTILNSRGINLAVGGFMEGVNHRGINVAMYNSGISMHGISVNASYNSVSEFKGVSIAGLGNFTEVSKGINIAPINKDKKMIGVQIGVLNKSTQVKGIQIGLINISDNLKGLQIGIFNQNGKRILPFINF